MKALDTPVLLEILRGRPGATTLLRSLAGEELATTELNLFELEQIARSDSPRGLEKRLAAIERLRRRITVLPIDERAVTSACSLSKGGRAAQSSTMARLMLGAAAAAGCSEWLTSRAFASAGGLGRLKVKVALRSHD